MTKTRDRQATEEKILSSATDEFAQYGYAGARVDRIAANADINKAMIYYYFSNKEVLYERVLKDTMSGIFSGLKDSLPASGDPAEMMNALMGKYISIIGNMDRRFMRIVLRELAGGGAYFRKVAIPNLVLPMLSIVEKIYSDGVKLDRFRDLDPYFTFFQIVGGIVFYNILKVPLEGSVLEEKLFGRDYLERFRENYVAVISKGILLER